VRRRGTGGKLAVLRLAQICGAPFVEHLEARRHADSSGKRFSSD